MHSHSDEGGSLIPGWHNNHANDPLALVDRKDPEGRGGLMMITHKGRRLDLYVDGDGALSGETFGDVTDRELDDLQKSVDDAQKLLAKEASKRRRK
jgi:hypothetical protein